MHELRRAQDRLRVLFGTSFVYICIYIYICVYMYIDPPLTTVIHTCIPSSPPPQQQSTGYDDAPVKRNTTKAHEHMGLWDLGTRRTLDQLIEFTGVDTRKKEVCVFVVVVLWCSSYVGW
jgi:hypothetical protein